jgi:hypothetical protein
LKSLPQQNDKTNSNPPNSTNMKKTLLTLVAGMIAVASTQAQPVEITITGATAFRVNNYTAIRALFDAGFAQNPIAGDPSLSNRVTWTGTMSTVFGARPVTVRTAQLGSTAGIQSLTANTTVSFLSSSTPGTFTTVSALADMSMSDIFQASSVFLTPTLEDAKAGVIPFVWVAGSSASSKLTNVTAQLARGMFNLGYFPLFCFTGDSADLAGGEIVNVVGRNASSGTRPSVLSEIGLGPLATVIQRKLNGTSTAWIDDPTGFGSNSLIPPQINSGVATSAEGPGGAIGYLDINDALTVTAAGGKFLKYDGVDFTKENVQNGKYTLWSYEHLFNRSGLAVDETAFRTALLNQLDADLATSVSAVQSSAMIVSRLADGAVVTP